MDADRGLSVLLACFNQAPFIADAVAGILLQRVGEPLDVIVADDASTDGTREIAARLLDGHPGITVRFLPAGPNLGPVRNYFRGFAACRTPLLATLDGDDYWTDPGKLAAQAKFLRANPECTICGTNFHVLDPATGAMAIRAPAGPEATFHSARDLVLDNLPGNMSACMYRCAALLSLSPELQSRRCGDWLLNLCTARSGPLAFLHTPMSVYRRNVGGVWGGLSREGQLRLLLDLVPEYDEATEGRHHDAFAAVAAGWTRELAELEHGSKP